MKKDSPLLTKCLEEDNCWSKYMYRVFFYTDLSEANVVFLSANVWRRDYQRKKKQISTDDQKFYELCVKHVTFFVRNLYHFP